VQGPDSAYWLQVFHKRNGAEVDGFPLRLPFAVTSGTALNSGEVFVGSLGSVNDAKTVVSYGLLGARPSWGHRTRGLLWATPTFDPGYGLLILASEDGRVTAIRSEGRGEAWINEVTGAVNVTPVVTPAHVVVAAQDGTLHGFDLSSGERKWVQGLDAPIHGRDRVWVVGRTVTERRSTGVEGAADIEVRTYRGIVFARNRNGLFAYALEDGTPLFHEQRAMAKPVGRHGRWVMTADGERRVLLRDAQEGYAVKGELNLRMFDLRPTNSTDGALYGITHDGGIVAAIPR
jgi:outer membrane protein assembly factor BamB